MGHEQLFRRFIYNADFLILNQFTNGRHRNQGSKLYCILPPGSLSLYILFNDERSDFSNLHYDQQESIGCKLKSDEI